MTEDGLMYAEMLRSIDSRLSVHQSEIFSRAIAALVADDYRISYQDVHDQIRCEAWIKSTIELLLEHEGQELTVLSVAQEQYKSIFGQ